MLIVGILFGLLVAAFLAIVAIAIVRGQPVSDPSIYRPDSHRTDGPFGGSEHSDSWAMRVAAQTFDRYHRHADSIPPGEATDIVIGGGRRHDD